MLDALEPGPVQGVQVRNRLMQSPFFGAALYRPVPICDNEPGEKLGINSANL
ncbi:MAG: hypothetical protein ACM3PY_03005 [Omnitrophica WOR_2 bacterium]